MPVGRARPGESVSLYGLHTLCHDLKSASNRHAFAVDPEAHMRAYDLSEHERAAIRAGDYPALFAMGVNIYLLVVLSGLRGIGLRQLAELMRSGKAAGPQTTG